MADGFGKPMGKVLGQVKRRRISLSVLLFAASFDENSGGRAVYEELLRKHKIALKQKI